MFTKPMIAVVTMSNGTTLPPAYISANDANALRDNIDSGKLNWTATFKAQASAEVDPGAQIQYQDKSI